MDIDAYVATPDIMPPTNTNHFVSKTKLKLNILENKK